MADDIAFSRGPARRPAPKLADPLLQWATGLPTDKKAIYAGWLCEAGRNIDFDEAMQRAGYQAQTQHSCQEPQQREAYGIVMR